jgi:DNA repair protein RadC
MFEKRQQQQPTRYGVPNPKHYFIMKHLINKVTVRLVKESSALYDAPKQIRGASDIQTIANAVFSMDELPEEHLIALYLNTKNVVVSVQEISKGTLNASLVHPREVLRGAILANANRFVIVHNHPSGSTEPSNADKQVTEVLKKAGELMQIELLDHVIIGNGYYSFRDKGLL